MSSRARPAIGLAMVLSGCGPDREPRLPEPNFALDTLSSESVECDGASRYEPGHGCRSVFERQSARVVLVNRIGGAFRLVAAGVGIDGRAVFRASGEAMLAGAELPVFEGALSPGAREVHVSLVLRGEGQGVFSYLRDYRFKVATWQSVRVTREPVLLELILYEREGATRPLEDRPALRIETQALR
ncbi:MAG: hypothetical protein KF718_02895 [Polyangiaceae bacterium]|nr:hypothetical protein [Polyangiaceae bacterium]